jgi:hypothetical protein
MRTSGLLVVLLCALVSVCAANDSARQSPSPAAVANPLSADWLNASGIVRPDFSGMAVDRADPDRPRLDSERDQDATCYTMHIFGMKRESPRSDVTVPDGQWTCRRASRYSMKKVDEPDEAPRR